MKKLIIILAFLPLVASARHRNITPVVQVPVPVTTSSLCFNIGHDEPSSAVFAAQLSILSAHNVSCVRIAYTGINNPKSEAYALTAKQRGFRVIIGNDSWFGSNQGTMSTDTFAAYDAGVIAEAKWAQTNKIDQLSLGNEQEYNLQISQANWTAHLRALAYQVRQVYSGKVSYETSGDFINAWVGQPLGDIDLLGFNLYCGVGCNENYLKTAINAFGATHVYVSETNADMDTSSYNSDSVHAIEVAGDVLKMQKDFPAIPIYYFAFGANGNGGVDGHWGLYSGTSVQQPLTASALGL